MKISLFCEGFEGVRTTKEPEFLVRNRHLKISNHKTTCIKSFKSEAHDMKMSLFFEFSFGLCRP